MEYVTDKLELQINTRLDGCTGRCSICGESLSQPLSRICNSAGTPEQ